MSYNAVCVFPQFLRWCFILLASSVYLLFLPKTLAITFFKYYLILFCWAVAFPKVRTSDMNSLVLPRNPGALKFNHTKLFLLILKKIRPYTADSPLNISYVVMDLTTNSEKPARVISRVKTRQASSHLAGGNISALLIPG